MPPTAPAATPLASAVIGHPSWRIDPGYLLLAPGDDLKVINAGGRGHTFTEVASFGGGFVPALRFGLAQAPECAAIAADPTKVVAAGGRTDVTGLAAGLHQFQCCIHPWMRALVKVE
jgi:plastocyanin